MHVTQLRNNDDMISKEGMKKIPNFAEMLM